MKLKKALKKKYKKEVHCETRSWMNVIGMFKPDIRNGSVIMRGKAVNWEYRENTGIINWNMTADNLREIAESCLEVANWLRWAELRIISDHPLYKSIPSYEFLKKVDTKDLQILYDFEVSVDSAEWINCLGNFKVKGSDSGCVYLIGQKIWEQYNGESKKVIGTKSWTMLHDSLFELAQACIEVADWLTQNRYIVQEHLEKIFTNSVVEWYYELDI